MSVTPRCPLEVHKPQAEEMAHKPFFFVQISPFHYVTFRLFQDGCFQ